MGEGNLVIFKGTAEGIVVILDESADFNEVLASFREKLDESKQFFKGSRVNMRFKGRSLSRKQQDELMSLLVHQNVVNISFVHEFEQEASEDNQDLKWTKEELKNLDGAPTYFHYGIVRSGHHIDYKGNVIVLGDVNPGGLITAGGNIIILGALKGKVHAGLDNKIVHPFVVSTLMAPIQIGIQNIIAQSPNGESIYDKEIKGIQIAYLHKDQIYVDQIDSKSLNHMLR